MTAGAAHNSKLRKSSSGLLCIRHMYCKTETKFFQVLRTMARDRGPEVRRRFFQLRVVDFLARELSLEHEVSIHVRLHVEFRGCQLPSFTQAVKHRLHSSVF